jgi:nitroreductase
MDFDSVIEKRRSIRKFLSVPLEKEAWASIIAAGSHAPSSGNLQNWKIIVVEDKAHKEKIAQICYSQMWIANAAILLVIGADTKLATQFYGVRGDRLYSVQNCAALTQNMLLKATHLGVGSCWVSAFDETKLKVHLNIPDHIRPQAIIALGYADEALPAPPIKSYAEYIYFNTYGNMMSDNMKDIQYRNFGKIVARRTSGLVQFFNDLKEKAKSVFKGQ